MALYYYTDFNTFKLILQNGTIRFKESTSSNDKTDTRLLFDYFIRAVDKRLKENKTEKQLEFVSNIFEKETKNTRRISLVSCYTELGDSRMLWDAYTMHRKNRGSKRYNGVCIEIDKEMLFTFLSLENSVFDWISIKPIEYGYEKMIPVIEKCIRDFNIQYNDLKDDLCQEQDLVSPLEVVAFSKKILLSFKKSIVLPTLNIMDIFEKNAPFYKHSFWMEEKETRALLSINRNSKKFYMIPKDENKNYFWDLHIDNRVIRKVILGPEFNEDDINEVKEIESVIDFKNLIIEKSNGTNIITNQ